MSHRLNAICPVCEQARRVTPGHEHDECRKCRHAEAARLALPDGDWRFDPFTRVQRWVAAA